MADFVFMLLIDTCRVPRKRIIVLTNVKFSMYVRDVFAGLLSINALNREGSMHVNTRRNETKIDVRLTRGHTYCGELLYLLCKGPYMWCCSLSISRSATSEVLVRAIQYLLMGYLEAQGREKQQARVRCRWTAARSVYASCYFRGCCCRVEAA